MLLEELIKNLDLQVQLHQEILDILHQELQMPASISLGALNDCHQRRDLCASKINLAERRRLDLMERYREQFQLQGEISLRTIMELSSDKEKTALQTLRSSLMRVVQEIQWTSKEIAERAVVRNNCISEVQNRLHRSLKRQSLYSKSGNITRPKGAVVLSRSI